MKLNPQHSLTWVCGLVVCLAIGEAGAAEAAELNSARERLLLDFNWRFHLGDDWGTGEDLVKAGGSSGPARPGFSDSSWRSLDLPHDWVIELPFDETADGSHGFKPVGPGFPQNSVGWYRRTFELPKDDAGKRLWLEFDGAYRDCRVYLNGYFVGHHESGYSSFRYDVTDVAHCGGKNFLAVRVDASQFEGWFYEGAGLYRHVWLVKTAPVAIVPDGTFVFTEFENNVPQGPAEIIVKTRLSNSETNSATVKVTCRVKGPDGTEVGEDDQEIELDALGEEELVQSMTVDAPNLWSPESPTLYTLVTTVEANDKLLDQTQTQFGIRTVAFDPDKGFLLNGQPYELKGTCNHQDHAGVGAALPDRIQYFRISRLKEMGCNAYRTSHNPPTPELLEACDRLGMLVMDENRLLGSDAANLERLAGLVLRDRNHPSVAVWSIANEESVQTTATGGRIGLTMQQLIHQLDPTRSVTMAANVGNDFGGINGIIDVRGWNYHIGKPMNDYHATHPLQPNVGTEQASTVCTRGIYTNDKERGYVSAYDDNAPEWANTTETWYKFFAARPWLSGGFAWTGFDYRGEPTPYGWPCINSHFGILDTCGFPKDNFFYYRAWWTDRPVVHLLPHWNWAGKEGQEIDVRCFSNCEEVELLLNGQSQGRQEVPKNSHVRWKVKYAPGVLSAKAFEHKQLVLEEKIETTEHPVGLIFSPDRAAINADGEDVSIVTIAIVDRQNRTFPLASNLVNFELTGPGRILGVGNGDPSCHEPDVYIQKPAMRAMALKDWRMKEVPEPSDRPEIAEQFSEDGWESANVQRRFGPLKPGRSAVFRAHFALTSDELSAPNLSVRFGTIDDEGWVYVNGKLAGEAHDWSTPHSFEIRKFLHEGANTIAVAVRNNAGEGGLNSGVTLEIQAPTVPVAWKRSVFKGLAQVLIQSSKTPGELKLVAQSSDLKSASVSIEAKACTPRPSVP